MPVTTIASRARHRIEAACSAGLDAQELLDTVADELCPAIGADGLFLAATDPETLLGLGAGLVQGIPDTVCAPFWEYEFEVPDYNKFTDLATGPQPVADLHAATGGRPQRSARWRELKRLMDADAELRAAFTANGRAWGVMHASRSGGSGGFGADAVALVEGLAPLIARGLRRALISQPACGPLNRGPGIATFDPDGRLLSATAEAVAWFDELVSIRPLPDPSGITVPGEVLIAAQEARARAGDPDGPARATRTRARTGSGAWLLIHASCLRCPAGTLGPTAVVIEPAKASEVAPLIVEAYGLTPREVDVTSALARGLSTNEIAASLHLSRYTVQDHLKAVYEKVGVSTRGELVARMFADHYEERLAEAVSARAA